MTPDEPAFDIDTGSDVPPYEQVRAQLAAAIDAGELPIGYRLPTVRRLAGRLELAVNTVARAYRELEASGLIETRGRHGSFVGGTSSPERVAAVEAARDYVRRTAELGLGPAESLAVVRRELGA